MSVLRCYQASNKETTSFSLLSKSHCVNQARCPVAPLRGHAPPWWQLQGPPAVLPGVDWQLHVCVFRLTGNVDRVPLLLSCCPDHHLPMHLHCAFGGQQGKLQFCKQELTGLLAEICFIPATLYFRAKNAFDVLTSLKGSPASGG